MILILEIFQKINRSLPWGILNIVMSSIESSRLGSPCTHKISISRLGSPCTLFQLLRIEDTLLSNFIFIWHDVIKGCTLNKSLILHDLNSQAIIYMFRTVPWAFTNFWKMSCVAHQGEIKKNFSFDWNSVLRCRSGQMDSLSLFPSSELRVLSISRIRMLLRVLMMDSSMH